MDLTAAAHQVPRRFLSASIGAAASAGRASVWLAHEGDQPVSTVWLTRVGACLGVMARGAKETDIDRCQPGGGGAIPPKPVRRVPVVSLGTTSSLDTPQARVSSPSTPEQNLAGSLPQISTGRIGGQAVVDGRV